MDHQHDRRHGEQRYWGEILRRIERQALGIERLIDDQRPAVM
jgi:hypothetical protein